MNNYTHGDFESIICYIQNHIYEPLPLARLASYAAYSPYHFTRLFKEKMGISPLYYVSSMRLQRAKDLLLNTNLSIRDVGMEIGQQSLGTFTTRFTERVGMTPSQFRNSVREAGESLRLLQHWEEWRAQPLVPNYGTTVAGIVQSEHSFEGVVLIGLFARPIPEGMPLYGTLVSSSLGSYALHNVKPGIYYLMATSVAWGTGAIDMLLPQQTMRTRSHKPLLIERYMPEYNADVHLYPPRLDDPPILISLPVLMKDFMGRIGSLRENHF